MVYIEIHIINIDTEISIIFVSSTNTRRHPDQVDKREVRPPPETDQFGVQSSRQNISSRFSAALDQPLLTQTVSEKMRTPR